MKIYDAKKIEIADVPVTKNARHEQELMKTDYIRLEWSQEEYMSLPVGAYIEHEGVKYSLLEEYAPDNNGGVYQYKPEFQHPMMLLAHTPCLLTTRDSIGKQIKQTDWSYTGILSTILGRLQGIIYDQLGIMLTFKTKFKPTTDVKESATCTFSGVDIISAFSEVCNQFGGIEYYIDWDGKTVWFGDIFLGDEVSLEEGSNVGMASKSTNSKDHANYFVVRGGTRNITNKTASGDNVQSDSRLSIDDIDKRASTEQPKVQKILTFDYIYPQLDLYVYNVRKRVRRLKDEDKQYVVKRYNDDGTVAEYQTYAVYYMRLAYKEGETWKDYNISNPSDDIVDGKKLTASFEPNENGTHSQLAGREYELIYHKADKTIIANPTIGDSGVNILAGDYEIVFEQDGDLIIPNIDTLQPWGNSTPDDTCDKVVLYNIVMSDEYITNAKVRLAEEAEKEIARQYTDKTNYTVNSNPIEFAKQNLGLSIGRAVRYRTLSGEVMSTRINRLVTQLDYPIEQEITLGNAVIKGNTQQLREEVKSISVAIDVNESSATRINSMLNSVMRELMEYDAHLLHKDRDDETAYKLTAGELLVKGIAEILGKLSTNGIENKGLTELYDAIRSNGFKDSMTPGSGWQIDKDGNAQVESIEVRSYMRVLDDVTVDRVHDANSTPDNRDIIGAQGFDLYMGDDGKSHLYIDYLVTRVKAFFAQLEIRRVSYSGGTTIFSNAGSTIAKVTTINDVEGGVLAYKCYAVADDGTTKTMNWWHVGMMALCQTFNVQDSVNYNESNRYYWRLVVRAGKERLDDGKTYDYVVLSNVKQFGGDEYAHGFIKPLATQMLYDEGVDKDDNGQKLKDRVFIGYGDGVQDAPAVGDVIVQVGDQIRWKSRGNVIKLSTSTEDNATDNAPAITLYHNIGAPDKTGDTLTPYQWKEETCLISPESVRINAKYFHLFADNPDNVIEPYVVMYEIVPTSSTLVKHDDGTTTPTSFGGELYKHMGGSKTAVEPTEYVIKAEVVYDDGKKDVLEGFASLSESVLRSVKSLKFVAYAAGTTNKLASCDIAVLKDGAESEPGANGESAIDVTWNPNPLVLSTKRDSNGNVSVVLDETRVAWVKFSRDGKYWGQNDVVVFYSVQQKGCNADVGRNENGFYVRIESVTQQSVTTSDGKVIKVPVTTASVTVAAKYRTKDGFYSNIYTTLEVNIDVSAVWGGIEMNMQGLTSSFTEISNKYNDLPLKTQGELTEFSTKFEQTARNFSLKVSETAVGRKNLLVGSAMRRQGEGVRTFIRYNAGIEMLNGVNGVNSFCFECVNIGEYPWMSWCGDVGGNIKVEKGKTYTLSVWAKRDSDEMYCYYELWYRPSQTTMHDEGSRPLFLRGAFAFAKKNTWELKTVTFTVPADAQTEYLEVMLVCTPEKSKTNTDKIHCWYCQPMLVEGDEYIGWSMSEKDADYVGGNLLDNTDTLKVGGNLTLCASNYTALHPQNDSADETNRQTYNGLPTMNTDIRFATNVNSIDMLEWTLDTDVVKKGQDYVFSFMAKGNKGGMFTAFFYHSNTTEVVFVEVLDRAYGPNQYQALDGNAQVEFKENYVWKRYWVHWRVVSDKLPISMLIRCNKGTDMYVSQPKLEYGATSTEYTTYRSMYSRLLDAGIDITSRQITLTADKTMFRTQSGKKVAVFNESGINAELINVDKAIANVIETGKLKAQNLEVAGNSTFGIWKIGHDDDLGDIITSKDTTVGGVEISGSMIQYTPAFVRSGNPVSAYMRTGAFVTEFGQGGVTGNYTGIWLGRSAYTVASGSSNSWNLPKNYQIQNSNVNVSNLTAYVYSPLNGETPSVYLYKPNGGVVMETNAVIRGGFANHVLSTSSDRSIDDSTGLVVANNNGYSITVILPTNPIAGQQVTVIQKGTGDVYIKSNKKNIRTVGSSSATNQRVSKNQGVISLFFYDGTDWNCTYISGGMGT